MYRNVYTRHLRWILINKYKYRRCVLQNLLLTLHLLLLGIQTYFFRVWFFYRWFSRKIIMDISCLSRRRYLKIMFYINKYNIVYTYNMYIAYIERTSMRLFVPHTCWSSCDWLLSLKPRRISISSIISDSILRTVCSFIRNIPCKVNAKNAYALTPLNSIIA